MSSIFSRRTPIDDSYGTCLETRATLLIYSDEVSPDEVTARLGLEPTQVNRAGESVVSPRGRLRIVKLNGWLLSSDTKNARP